jgi:adenine deaminase
VNDNFRAVSDALALGRDEIAAIIRNSFKASLMPTAAKTNALAEIDRIMAATELRRGDAAPPSGST